MVLLLNNSVRWSVTHGADDAYIADAVSEAATTVGGGRWRDVQGVAVCPRMRTEAAGGQTPQFIKGQSLQKQCVVCFLMGAPSGSA